MNYLQEIPGRMYQYIEQYYYILKNEKKFESEL